MCEGKYRGEASPPLEQGEALDDRVSTRFNLFGHSPRDALTKEALQVALLVVEEGLENRIGESSKKEGSTSLIGNCYISLPLKRSKPPRHTQRLGLERPYFPPPLLGSGQQTQMLIDWKAYN